MSYYFFRVIVSKSRAHWRRATPVDCIRHKGPLSKLLLCIFTLEHNPVSSGFRAPTQKTNAVDLSVLL